jgi:23S rRNA pseudouridine1911/1915/1917 synthase
MFKENSIKKTYWAVVSKIDESKEIRLEDFLLKNNKQNKSYVKSDKNINAKKISFILQTNTHS